MLEKIDAAALWSSYPAALDEVIYFAAICDDVDEKPLDGRSALASVTSSFLR
jgi:hypothetical protein